MFEFLNLFKKDPVKKSFLENKQLLEKIGIDYSEQQHADYLENLKISKRDPLSIKGFVQQHLSGNYIGKTRFDKELDFISKSKLIEDYFTSLGDVINRQVGIHEERQPIHYFPPEPSAPKEKSIWHFVIANTNKSAPII